jgi:hypothetical protein
MGMPAEDFGEFNANREHAKEHRGNFEKAVEKRFIGILNNHIRLLIRNR